MPALRCAGCRYCTARHENRRGQLFRRQQNAALDSGAGFQLETAQKVDPRRHAAEHGGDRTQQPGLGRAELRHLRLEPEEQPPQGARTPPDPHRARSPGAWEWRRIPRPSCSAVRASSGPGLETSVTRKPASRSVRSRPPRTRQVCALVMPTTMRGCGERRGFCAEGATEDVRRLLTLQNVGRNSATAIDMLRLNTSPSQKGPSRPDTKPVSKTRMERCSKDSGVHAYGALEPRQSPTKALPLPFSDSTAFLVTTQIETYKGGLTLEIIKLSTHRKH
jgi:hypothetical protein